MNSLTRLSSILLSLCATPLLTGCFTGVESTPTITDSEVRRQTSATPAESSFLQPLVDSLNSSPLRPGTPLLVTDTKIRLVVEPAAAAESIQADDTLRLSAVEAASTLDGRQVAEIRLTDNSGQQFHHRTTLDPERVKTLSDLHIPFCIPLNVVDAVARKLNGRKMFITSSSRYDLNDNFYTGRRFVPVEVTAVEPGNAYYPVRLTLRDDRDVTFHIFLSVDDASPMPRKFSSLFSMTDPRLNYPAITDATWRNIVDGRVASGMTREECRLALGSPDNVDRQAGYSSVREIWTYKNGRFLVFIDGLLDTFRQ